MRDLITVLIILTVAALALTYLRRRHLRRTAPERPSKVFVGVDPARPSCVVVRDGQKLHDEVERLYREET